MTGPTTTTQGEALEALLPCPFCGSHTIQPDQFSPINGDEWRFLCANKQCETWGPERKNQEEARAAWNTRAALQPNIDHAVGGLDRETLIRAMYEAWPHTVTSQALNELTGLPYGATIRYDMAQRCGASFVALERYADGILALSAPQQPVKLDAVREDGDFVCPACMCREFARVQTADLQETDDVRCVGCKRAYSLPLATPSTDTGLDKAMREAVALIDEVNKRVSARAFNGINQHLHAKLCTIRATLARALASGDRS